MQNIKRFKASRNEIRFGKAIRSQKVLTEEELKAWSDDCNKSSIKKIWADRQSIYYGHEENKHKDLGARKNWRLKHPDYKPNRLEMGL